MLFEEGAVSLVEFIVAVFVVVSLFAYKTTWKLLKFITPILFKFAKKVFQNWKSKRATKRAAKRAARPVKVSEKIVYKTPEIFESEKCLAPAKHWKETI
jgi:ABC-type transport system involved in Fe-S cluster assembly fused permease/ATPase subunit